MAPRSVITGLSATVRTEHGRKILRRGESLPEDALPGEGKRLADLGVYGVPVDRNADTRDEAQVLADELAAQHAAEERSRGIEPEPEVAAAEEVEPEPEEDEVGLTAFLKTASIDQVLDRIEKEPEIGATLLDLARADEEAPEGLVAALEVQLGVEPSASGEDAGNGAPAEPVDYSDWKGPQLNAELEKRGIEFKPVGEKNAAKAEKLIADDAAKAAA